MPKISALTAATAPDADDLLYIVEDGNSRKATIDQVVKAATNATGTAPIYACRAWVNFNGTGTVAIRASGNVSSITDLGIGTYRINFETAMPNANYSVSHFSKWSSGPFILGVAGGEVGYNASYLDVINGSTGGADTDIDVISLAIFC